MNYFFGNARYCSLHGEFIGTQCPYCPHSSYVTVHPPPESAQLVRIEALLERIAVALEQGA